MSKNAGFTLVELVVVLTIMGILSLYALKGLEVLKPEAERLRDDQIEVFDSYEQMMEENNLIIYEK